MKALNMNNIESEISNYILGEVKQDIGEETFKGYDL